MTNIEAILADFKKEFIKYDSPDCEDSFLDAAGDGGRSVLWLKSKLTSFEKEIREEGVTENTSDGYHTFKELYEFRKLYNATLFNEWANGWSHGFAVKYDVHKSKKHHDGEKCFGGGWFIVMAQTPSGQISNHYELKDWDLFNVPEKERANEWDGHTAKDVIIRLKSLSTKEE